MHTGSPNLVRSPGVGIAPDDPIATGTYALPDPAIRVTQPREWRRELHPSSEDRRPGAVTSETVAFLDTPLPGMGAAAAEAWGIHHWSPQR